LQTQPVIVTNIRVNLRISATSLVMQGQTQRLIGSLT
jgi:hypothetical protein